MKIVGRMIHGPAAATSGPAAAGASIQQHVTYRTQHVLGRSSTCTATVCQRSRRHHLAVPMASYASSQPQLTVQARRRQQSLAQARPLTQARPLACNTLIKAVGQGQEHDTSAWEDTFENMVVDDKLLYDELGLTQEEVEEQRLWSGAAFTDPEGMDLDFDQVSSLSEEVPEDLRMALMDNKVYGPEAVVLAGFRLEEYGIVRGVLDSAGGHAVKVLPSSPEMLHESVDAAIWQAERDWESPRQMQEYATDAAGSSWGAQRVALFSGMNIKAQATTLELLEGVGLGPIAVTMALEDDGPRRLGDVLADALKEDRKRRGMGTPTQRTPPPPPGPSPQRDRNDWATKQLGPEHMGGHDSLPAGMRTRMVSNPDQLGELEALIVAKDRLNYGTDETVAAAPAPGPAQPDDEDSTDSSATDSQNAPSPILLSLLQRHGSSPPQLAPTPPDDSQTTWASSSPAQAQPAPTPSNDRYKAWASSFPTTQAQPPPNTDTVSTSPQTSSTNTSTSGPPAMQPEPKDKGLEGSQAGLFDFENPLDDLLGLVAPSSKTPASTPDSSGNTQSQPAAGTQAVHAGVQAGVQGPGSMLEKIQAAMMRGATPDELKQIIDSAFTISPPQEPGLQLPLTAKDTAKQAQQATATNMAGPQPAQATPPRNKTRELLARSQALAAARRAAGPGGLPVGNSPLSTPASTPTTSPANGSTSPNQPKLTTKSGPAVPYGPVPPPPPNPYEAEASALLNLRPEVIRALKGKNIRMLDLSKLPAKHRQAVAESTRLRAAPGGQTPISNAPSTPLYPLDRPASSPAGPSPAAGPPLATPPPSTASAPPSAPGPGSRLLDELAETSFVVPTAAGEALRSGAPPEPGLEEVSADEVHTWQRNMLLRNLRERLTPEEVQDQAQAAAVARGAGQRRLQPRLLGRRGRQWQSAQAEARALEAQEQAQEAEEETNRTAFRPQVFGRRGRQHQAAVPGSQNSGAEQSEDAVGNVDGSERRVLRGKADKEEEEDSPMLTTSRELTADQVIDLCEAAESAGLSPQQMLAEAMAIGVVVRQQTAAQAGIALPPRALIAAAKARLEQELLQEEEELGKSTANQTDRQQGVRKTETGEVGQGRQDADKQHLTDGRGRQGRRLGSLSQRRRTSGGRSRDWDVDIEEDGVEELDEFESNVQEDEEGGLYRLDHDGVTVDVEALSLGPALTAPPTVPEQEVALNDLADAGML